MLAKAVDLAVGLDGKQRITFQVEGDARAFFQSHRDKPVELTAKQPRKKRSLDANAYAWVLMDRLAAELGLTKTEVYHACIREIGGVSQTVCVPSGGVDKLREGWKHNGLGWISDAMPSKIPGCTNVILYYGSSTYDSRQMSALIDAVVEACRAVDIETATPAEIERYKEEWRA